MRRKLRGSLASDTIVRLKHVRKIERTHRPGVKGIVASKIARQGARGTGGRPEGTWPYGTLWPMKRNPEKDTKKYETLVGGEKGKKNINSNRCWRSLATVHHKCHHLRGVPS